MKKQGPLGAPRALSGMPLVSKPVDSDRVYPDELKSMMEEVADDVEVSELGSNSSASVDFRIRSEPKRELKSSVIVFEKLGPNEATFRLPLINPALMSSSEVNGNLQKVITRSNAPDSTRTENPTRFHVSDEHDEAHNPHILWSNDSGTSYEEFTSWVERLTRAFNQMFPKEVRLAES